MIVSANILRNIAPKKLRDEIALHRRYDPPTVELLLSLRALGERLLYPGQWAKRWPSAAAFKELAGMLRYVIEEGDELENMLMYAPSFVHAGTRVLHRKLATRYVAPRLAVAVRAAGAWLEANAGTHSIEVMPEWIEDDEDFAGAAQ